MKARITTIAMLAALAMGCEDRGGAERAAPAAEESVPGPQSDVPLTEQMHETFTATVTARDAVVRGDLDRARAAGREIAEVEPSADLPALWRPYSTRMREGARRLATAGNVDQAALEVGKLAVLCGDCHGSLNVRLSFDDNPPPSGDDVATHMLRHQWATDRLWEGLIAPDDARFTGAASALVEAPLHPHAIASDRTVPEDIAQLATRVHELGENATRATQPDDRAQLYAELLATCTGCHTQLEAAPH